MMTIRRRNDNMRNTNKLLTNGNINRLSEFNKNKLNEEITILNKEIFNLEQQKISKKKVMNDEIERLEKKMNEEKTSINAEIKLKEEKKKEINKKLNPKRFWLFGGNKTKRKYKK